MTPAASLTALDSWRSRVRAAPGSTALVYFDCTLSVGETDDLSDAVAVVLRERGVGCGDVVGIALQNCPQFVLTVLALWKIGAAPLLINPMYHGEELEYLLSDSGAVGVVCDTREAEHVSATCERVGAWSLATSSRHFQTRDDDRVLGPEPAATRQADLVELAMQRLGERPEAKTPDPASCAFLTYTSGTTGPPKGAVNTHAAVLASASGFASVAGLDERDTVLAMAPLFHITGAVINAVVGLVSGSPLVLTERFHPGVVLDAFVEHRVTFTVAAITAYLSLAGSTRATPEVFAGVRALYSGGAPVSPATVESLERRLGHYVHNVYGMTETTSAVVAVPLGTRAPVDVASGVLSVGKAMPGVTLRVVDPDGFPLGPGGQGELEVSGPSVVPGYWRNPEATADAMPNGALRTGDGAIVDADGWVYIVDRLKDQINTSGYKVWPREVEEVLLRHDDVQQVAVVGLPDAYRGERVSAFVVTKPGATVTDMDLIALARKHLAAYKAPREVRLVAHLPTTTSGKIQRRHLRSQT